MGHSFSEEYVPTIEDTYRRALMVEGESCLLEVVDTSGDPLFFSVTERQFKTGDVFIIVFAVDNFNSYEVATDYINKICLAKDISHPTIVMVSNKCDLDKRKVDLHFAKHHAEACNIPFFQA